MVNVVGLGYIGLPTVLMLAAHGVKVTGTDYNKELVENLNDGKLSFKEEGLEELYWTAREKGVSFTMEYVKADVYIISVPTPYEDLTKKVDASYVVKAVRSVLDVCTRGSIIVIESTISPGTIDTYIRPVIREYNFEIGRDIHLAHAPERIIPGNMIHELLNNDRTIGADDPVIGEKIKKIYSSFCQGTITVTSIRAAEMTKVVENTFRDINIAYANELVRICHEQNLDVYEIIRIANQHPRVNILSPGPGVGGHCIPIDPWFLVGDFPSLTHVIKAAREVNDSMPEYVLSRVSEVMNICGIEDISRVGFYGLTYKADVDDVRDSPTLQMLDSLKRHLCGCRVKVYDPMVEKDIVPNQYHNLDVFLDAVDLVVILVDHREIKSNMKKLEGKIIFDTRHVCSLEGVYHL
ncbi:MAG: nucleotide sugar dehydrogenase [Lachnospiraceae bacterium]